MALGKGERQRFKINTVLKTNDIPINLNIYVYSTIVSTKMQGEQRGKPASGCDHW